MSYNSLRLLRLRARQGQRGGGPAGGGHGDELVLAVGEATLRWRPQSGVLASIENTPVLLTCPLLESMPFHLWEFAA